MPSHKDTIASRLARVCARVANEESPPVVAGPNVRGYSDDPLGFAHDILGVETYSRQAEMIAAAYEHLRLAIVSGHRTGKSTSIAVIALWYYCSYPEARVIITAPTDRQVNGVIWHEIKRLVTKAKVMIPRGGRLQKKAITGLTDPTTGAEIRGFTARDAEAMQGIAGKNLLFLVDEASGVEEAIFEAIAGNRAGGKARLILTGNPTKASGTFYDAFHGKKDLFHTIHVDSRESPNFDPSLPRIEGLADPDWLAERIRDWGESGPLFEVRVAGKFTVAEDAKIFPLHVLTTAQARWYETTPAIDDRLWIGLDPASGAEGGDETAMCIRRGKKVIDIVTRRGLNEAGILVALLDQLLTHRTPIDAKVKPIVVLDAEGGVGVTVKRAFQEHLQNTPTFELAPVRGSLPATRQPRAFATTRDELAWQAKRWLTEGGAIPEHRKLEQELHTLEWLEGKRGGRTQLMKKEGPKSIRSILGRSPDSADAFMLAVWEPPLSTGSRTEHVGNVYTAAPSRQHVESNPYRQLEWMRPAAGDD